jgi:hypothetical protein
LRIGQYSLAAILNDLAGLIDAGPMDSHEELLRSSPYSSTAAGTIDNTSISSRFAEKERRCGPQGAMRERSADE